MSVEVCANCGRVLLSSEQAYIVKGKIVCAECNRALVNKQSPQLTSSPKPTVSAENATPPSPALTQSVRSRRTRLVWIIGAIGIVAISAVIMLVVLLKSDSIIPTQRTSIAWGEKGKSVSTIPASGTNIPFKKEKNIPITSLDKEAAEQALDRWKPTKLGQSHYVHMIESYDNTNRKRTIFELRNALLQICPLSLSKPDLLNGVEWRGLIVLQADATRTYVPEYLGHQPDITWSPWKNIWLFVMFYKVHGKWNVDNLTTQTLSSIIKEKAFLLNADNKSAANLIAVDQLVDNKIDDLIAAGIIILDSFSFKFEQVEPSVLPTEPGAGQVANIPSPKEDIRAELDTIKRGEMIWLKCRNPKCENTWQMDSKAYYEYVDKNRVGLVVPGIPCPKCGEKDGYKATEEKK